MPCDMIYDIYKAYRWRTLELYDLATRDVPAARKLFAEIRRDFRQEATEREKLDPSDRIAKALRRALATKHVTAPTATEYQLRKWAVDAGVALSKK